MEELENGTSVHMTEKSVKERLKLKDAPEEVRSISLPGSKSRILIKFTTITCL